MIDLHAPDVLPRKITPIPIDQEAGLAPKRVWMFSRKRKYLNTAPSSKSLSNYAKCVTPVPILRPLLSGTQKTHFNQNLKLANVRTSNKAEMTSTLRIFQLPTAAKMLTYFGMCVKDCFVILGVSKNPRVSLVRKQFEAEIKE